MHVRSDAEPLEEKPIGNGFPVGKAAGRQIRRHKAKLQGQRPLKVEVLAGSAKKTFVRRSMADRTKTDTGRRGEKPQALERTPLKELGKMTP